MKTATEQEIYRALMPIALDYGVEIDDIKGNIRTDGAIRARHKAAHVLCQIMSTKDAAKELNRSADSIRKYTRITCREHGPRKCILDMRGMLRGNVL